MQILVNTLQQQTPEAKVEKGDNESFGSFMFFATLGSNLEFNLNWILASTILQVGPRSGMIMYL